MREKILALIENNSKITVKELADILGEMKPRSRKKLPEWKRNT